MFITFQNTISTNLIHSTHAYSNITVETDERLHVLETTNKGLPKLNQNVVNKVKYKFTKRVFMTLRTNYGTSRQVTILCFGNTNIKIMLREKIVN